MPNHKLYKNVCLEKIHPVVQQNTICRTYVNVIIIIIIIIIIIVKEEAGKII